MQSTGNSCQTLTKLVLSGQIFKKKKNSNIKNLENLSGGSRVVQCGQTDEAFGNFVNVPKNSDSYKRQRCQSCHSYGKLRT